MWFIVAQCPHRYDPHINKWMEVAPMAKRRAGVGLAALNGYLYAVGGFDDASPLETVERLVGVFFLWAWFAWEQWLLVCTCGFATFPVYHKSVFISLSLSLFLCFPNVLHVHMCG